MLLETYPSLSLIPPLLAIILAISTRQVYLSLFMGIATGTTLLANGNLLKGTGDALERCILVFTDPASTRVIIFSILVGSLITLLQRSGGIEGFSRAVMMRGIAQNKRAVEFLAFAIGILIFIESSITCLVTGMVARPLSDRHRISREKLAYLCDTTSAPICSLIPLNAWGAYVTTLLEREGLSNATELFVSSILLNFYALIAVLLLFLVITFQFDFGPMREAEYRAQHTGKVLRNGAQPAMTDEITHLLPKPGTSPRAVNMLVPLAVMVLTIIAGLFVTGEGHFARGSGSTSVLWAVSAAILSAAFLYKIQNIMNLQEIVDLVIKGAGGLVGLGILMVMAFAIGAICREMNTATYIAGTFSSLLNSKLLPPLLFIISAFIAFSTGTSFGTWAIMFPLAIPLAIARNVPLPPVIGALLSGGVFGDHCSPISDTTIISSMAAASDHIDHVRTQLPYALAAALGAAILFLMVGVLTC